jgi:glycosyltransferase
MRLVSEPDGGIYHALNKGMALASGDIIGLVHSDDFLAHEEVLARVAAAFADPAIDAVYGDLDYVAADDPTRVVRRWRSGAFDPGKLRRGWMPPHPALFIRRAVFETHGGYDTSYRIAADYEAILRWFGRGGVRAAYIPEVLVKMRLGGASNGSLGRILQKSREDYRALRSSGVGGLGALAFKNLGKLPQLIVR